MTLDEIKALSDSALATIVRSKALAECRAQVALLNATGRQVGPALQRYLDVLDMVERFVAGEASRADVETWLAFYEGAE